MNNKGITLISLVIYIAVVFVVLAALMRITTYFSSNIRDSADVSFETEFNKLNLYLMDETESVGNKIVEIINGTQVTFFSGNKYTYNAEDKKVYLNDNIKICENIEDCLFEQRTAENGKSVLFLTITINEITKTTEYVMAKETDGTDEVNMQEYLWDGSLASYYLKAGDYVDYTPDTGTYTVASGATGSGYTSNQTFTTETGESSLKWRVLSIDEKTGKIELVSATAAQISTQLYLQGADGYNHAVDILNDLCETLYSKKVNGTKVATGRSINMEDINAKTTYSPIGETNTVTGITYKDTKRLSEYGTSYMKYPNLYTQEIGYGTAGTFNTTGLDGETGLKDGVTDEETGVTTYSNVTGYTDGNVAGTDPYVTHTYYGYNGSSYTYYPEQCLDTSLGVNTAPTGLIKLSNTYWLASRCTDAYSQNASFHVRKMKYSGDVNDYILFWSGGHEDAPSCAVRPVVSLSVNLLNFSVGDGSEENPWGMK
ncbi:MAG: hypothetical protein J6A29_00905 [Clostridia bacterium]|nr:hypothetical protein [Clostridia bacterium]